MTILRWENLSFKNIIKFPDYQLKEGSMSFISGPSGTGKSSLLKLLNKTNHPSSGDIYFNESSISKIEDHLLRKDICLVGQTPFLFDITIRENFHKIYGLKEMQPLSDEEIISWLSLCSIDIPLDKVATTLSGGEKQRIFLAISISFKPKILLLDEPTSALDYISSMEVIRNIKSLKTTSLIVSHTKEIVDEFADDVLFLEEKGKGNFNG